MPAAADPEQLPDWEVLRAQMLRQPEAVRPQPIEVRTCDPDDPDGKPQPPAKRVWMRPVGRVPDDPRIHEALLVYASDRTLLSTASRPHGLPWGKRMVASLDHAMWLHRPARFDDWVLYASHSPVAHAARGLVLGAMYDRERRPHRLGRSGRPGPHPDRSDGAGPSPFRRLAVAGGAGARHLPERGE